MASVSVIVPLYNGRDLIGDCLRSVPRDVELIVVDDGSTDGAPDVVAAEFPHARLLFNPENRGFAATCNRGLSVATGSVRVLLNSDARLRAGAPDALVRAFDDPGVGVAGPRLVFADGGHQISAASFPTVGSIVTGSFLLNEVARRLRPGHRFRYELGLARQDHDTSQDVDWVKGACLCIRDRCFDDIGGFDEGYYMYVEETDLCLRAQRAGWRVRYVAEATVTHLGGGSTGDPTIHAERLVGSEARFMARAYGPAVLPRWRAARMSGAAIKIPVLAVPAVVDRRARARLRWQLSALRAAWRWKPSAEDAVGEGPVGRP